MFSRTCAIIDDDSDWFELTERSLRTAGVKLSSITFGDPLHALEQLRLHPPEIVITDFRMPRLDGCSFTRRLRASHADLPVIIMSSDSVAARQVVDCGANWFVPKRHINSELPYAVCTLLGIPFDPSHAVRSGVFVPPSLTEFKDR
jgi:DNA-binding response OmpR family regulator